MRHFEEAQASFRSYPTHNSAEVLNKVAWKAYLAGRITEEDMRTAMDELEAFWGEADVKSGAGAH